MAAERLELSSLRNTMLFLLEGFLLAAVWALLRFAFRLFFKPTLAAFKSRQLFSPHCNVSLKAKDENPLVRAKKALPNHIASFRRKPESSSFKVFRTPAPAPDSDPGFAGVTG
jgi:hypothetical protein